MRFMNDYDIEHALNRFLSPVGSLSDSRTPNRARAAVLVNNIADWTNDHSDGWAHWLKPRRAADKLMALVESRTYAENNAQEATDATDAELAAAVRPLKSFLTRHGVSDADRAAILAPLDV
jgi:hypothetical protein